MRAIAIITQEGLATTAVRAIILATLAGHGVPFPASASRR